MGTMNKMRENTGVILWILVISFGGLWVLQDSNVFDTIGNISGDIIVVDGETVTYEEYNNAVEAQVEAYRQQTGESMPPQRLDQERDRVFEALVDNKLREQEMDRLGITVTDGEVFELVLGDNPHPIITAYFNDGQGGVDQTLLQNFIDNPDAQEQWIQLENYLRSERRRQKLDNLVAATVRVSDVDVMEEYHKRNASVSVEFFSLRYGSLPDDSVQLSDRELRRFYDENRDDFERPRSYTLKIAKLSKLPSPEDTLAFFEDLEKLRPTFETTDDDSLFLARYGSERPYSSAFFGRADLDETLAEAVFEDPQPGKIVGPILSGPEVHLVKIVEVRPAEEVNVRARHILIRATEGNAEEKAEARRKAQDLKRRLNAGEDFDALAREASQDPGSAARGGDLGWFGPGAMVEPFQEAAFAAPVGRVVGPVETRFGYHLIEVTDRATQEVRLADYAQQLRASAATLNAGQERLEDLQFYAEETGNFVEEANRAGIALVDVQVEEGQQIIPDFGNSSRLMAFLKKAEEGALSPVIELDDDFAVAYVAEIQEAGYQPFDEVQAQIRPRALVEKKREVQRRRMEEAYAQGGYDGLAGALNLAPRRAQQLTFNNMLVPGLGRDPIFVGSVMALTQGGDTGVVEGENAVFVARVMSVTDPPPPSDVEREKLRKELLDRRRNEVKTQWVASLRDKADVEDFRSNFLR